MTQLFIQTIRQCKGQVASKNMCLFKFFQSSKCMGLPY